MSLYVFPDASRRIQVDLHHIYSQIHRGVKQSTTSYAVVRKVCLGRGCQRGYGRWLGSRILALNWSYLGDHWELCAHTSQSRRW